jgi:hypothetical protein
MEQHGRPAVTVVTEAFEAAAVARAAALGLPDHPRVTVAHPLASRRVDEVSEMAAGKPRSDGSVDLYDTRGRRGLEVGPDRPRRK